MIEKDDQIPLTSISAKWGPTVAAGGYGSGWTSVPSALIRNIGKLGLSGTDFTVLTVILSYWWEADRMPSPRVVGIANLLGMSPRTVERSIARLRRKGLLVWRQAQNTHRGLRRVFDLQPLRKKVDELAEHDLMFFAESYPIGDNKASSNGEDFDDDVPV